MVVKGNLKLFPMEAGGFCVSPGSLTERQEASVLAREASLKGTPPTPNRSIWQDPVKQRFSPHHGYLFGKCSVGAC